MEFVNEILFTGKRLPKNIQCESKLTDLISLLTYRRRKLPPRFIWQVLTQYILL